MECVSCDSYTAMANSLVILEDPVLGIHPEYEGYSGAVIKQADVVLLHYPLGMDMPLTLQKADLEYYSERTDHGGPAMTWGMHAIGYLDLDEFDEADKFFNMSFQDNMHEPMHIWTEVVSLLFCLFVCDYLCAEYASRLLPNLLITCLCLFDSQLEGLLILLLEQVVFFRLLLWAIQEFVCNLQVICCD